MWNFTVKVEKILKGSLDSMPPPSLSVESQIMGGKVCLRCKGKKLLGIVNKLLKTKSLLITMILSIVQDSKKAWLQLDFNSGKVENIFKGSLDLIPSP